jgi:hypothetical protein
MTTIQAWQHIYSNVEKEQSPRGRGGFQTLFYSAGLGEAEIEEMEGRLLYFASKVEPVKRLFFPTSTGKGAVAQIVALSATDQYGRGGRYLAHSLVFSAEALAKFEADPFRVFRYFSFISNVAEALAQGDFKTGSIPMVSLDLPAGLAGEVKVAKAWPAPELKKLSLLALRVEQQAQAREAITFVGDEEQIENALEAAFLAVPVSMRPRCSFDTYFYRCNLVATYFWAIGLPESPVSIKFAQVEGSSRQVKGNAPTQSESAYEHWVAEMIEAGNLDKIVQEREKAFALGEWLDGRSYDLTLLNAASPELVAAIFKASPSSVRASLQRQVSQKLPTELAERAANHLFQKTVGAALYRQLRQGFELPELLNALYESYEAEQFKTPARSELKALEPLLEQADHKLLRLFLAYWQNERKQLSEILKWAEEADYRRFGELALKFELIKPFNLLMPGRGDQFLDLYLNRHVDNLLDLAEALIQANETACLSRLNSYVSHLERRELNKLNKLIEDQADTPQQFRQAVAKAIAALPEEGGVKGMLKAVWRRRPGRGE